MLLYKEVTKEYYAKWLGTDANNLEKDGMRWIYNSQRNTTPPGYPSSIDVYMFIKCNSIIVSYGDRALPQIPKIKEQLKVGMTAETIGSVCKEIFMSQPKHNIKYVYTGDTKENDKSAARRLTYGDYSLYLDFFKKAYPHCKNTSWVEDYFRDIFEKGYCYGVIINNQLVSATDAPDMPFMSEQIQEIGINTLPSYQGKGYGKMSCLACLNEMKDNNICPIWSTTIDNIASQKLAVSIGFEKLFDNVSLNL